MATTQAGLQANKTKVATDRTRGLIIRSVIHRVLLAGFLSRQRFMETEGLKGCLLRRTRRDLLGKDQVRHPHTVKFRVANSPHCSFLIEELILRACRADPNASAKLREYDESAGPRKRRKTAEPVEPVEPAEQAAQAAEATVAQRRATGQPSSAFVGVSWAKTGGWPRSGTTGGCSTWAVSRRRSS